MPEMFCRRDCNICIASAGGRHSENLMPEMAVSSTDGSKSAANRVRRSRRASAIRSIVTSDSKLMARSSLSGQFNAITQHKFASSGLGFVALGVGLFSVHVDLEADLQFQLGRRGEVAEHFGVEVHLLLRRDGSAAADDSCSGWRRGCLYRVNFFRIATARITFLGSVCDESDARTYSEKTPASACKQSKWAEAAGVRSPNGKWF